MALAKVRPWRGLTATTGSPTLPRAASTATSRPPVASSTISPGPTARKRATSALMPAGSLPTCQQSPVGRVAISRLSRETSIPTNTSVAAIRPPHSYTRLPWPNLAGCGLAVRPRQLFGLLAGPDWDDHASRRTQWAKGANGLSQSLTFVLSAFAEDTTKIQGVRSTPKRGSPRGVGSEARAEQRLAAGGAAPPNRSRVLRKTRRAWHGACFTRKWSQP